MDAVIAALAMALFPIAYLIISSKDKKKRKR